MFKRSKKNIKRDIKKQSVPAFIWVLMLMGAIFGIILTRYCHKQLDEYLEVKNIVVEQKAKTFAQISFEIKNKADFTIKRKVITRVYSGNLELGSKMIMAKIEPGKTVGYYVTIEFIKVLEENESLDEISVRFYD